MSGTTKTGQATGVNTTPLPTDPLARALMGMQDPKAFDAHGRLNPEWTALTKRALGADAQGVVSPDQTKMVLMTTILGLRTYGAVSCNLAEKAAAGGALLAINGALDKDMMQTIQRFSAPQWERALPGVQLQLPDAKGRGELKAATQLGVEAIAKSMSNCEKLTFDKALYDGSQQLPAPLGRTVALQEAGPVRPK